MNLHNEARNSGHDSPSVLLRAGVIYNSRSLTANTIETFNTGPQ